MMRGAWRTMRALSAGYWRDGRGRVLLAVFAIACGVALGTAVHLINASAITEFSAATRSLAGTADITVRSPRAAFDESLYPRVAQLPAVAGVSPALELEAAVPGRRSSLRVMGLDPLQAARVQPGLLGAGTVSTLRLLEADTAVLSQAAADWLGIGRDDILELQSGTQRVRLRVVDVLAADHYAQRLAVVDIATVQWRFDRLGLLNRMDVRLRPGISAAAAQKELEALLPPGVHATTPETSSSTAGSLSRGYRTNLDMLALVALFTGGFLVFSTQFLSLLRRRTQLAVLRALGITRRRMAIMLMAEGALTGTVGAAIGVALGYTLAALAVRHLGADLGAGYFSGIAPRLHADPIALAILFALGVLFAVLGAAVPAWEAARRPPARALKAGDEEDAYAGLATPWPAVVLLAAAAVLTRLPAVDGVPVAGYAAIACMLLAAVTAMPWLTALILQRLHGGRFAGATLAIAQLQATPRQAAMSLAAILTSFSLMVSMLIMIASFRTSLEAWLTAVLPADLYLRAGSAGETAYFGPREREQLRTTPGVREMVFLRAAAIPVQADKPPLTLLGRSGLAADPQRWLPLQGPALKTDPAAPPPAWISEIAADVMHWRAGEVIRIPLGGRMHDFTVAGIWRDYARQNGAVAIDLALYERLTGDARVSEAAVWIEAGTDAAGIAGAIHHRLGDASAVETASTRELRERSLAMFDRTFAVTYALELAAILLGLSGISTSFSAQALSRRREFGVLRHLGMTRLQIARMIAWEGAIVSLLGILSGILLGWLISLVLIDVINRQSFHWSMEITAPWSVLAALSLVLFVAATVTAVISARQAMRTESVRAVREDW